MRQFWLSSTAVSAAILSFGLAGTALAGGDPFAYRGGEAAVTSTEYISAPQVSTVTSAPQVVYTSHVQAGDATPVTVGQQPVVWNPFTQSAAAPGYPQVQWNADGWAAPSPIYTPNYQPQPQPQPMAYQPVFIPAPQPLPIAPAPAPEPEVVELPKVEVVVPTPVPAPLPAPHYGGPYLSLKAARVWADNFNIGFEDSGDLSTAAIDDGDGWGGSIAIGQRIDSMVPSAIPAMRVELQGSRYNWKDNGGNFAVATPYSIDIPQSVAGPVLTTGVSATKERFTGLFGNLIAELGNGQARPYLGAGVGYGRRETTATLSDGTDSIDREMKSEGITFQGMAGFNFAVGENLGLEVGYKFIHLPKHDRRQLTINEGGAAVSHFDQASHRNLHILEGGVTFGF